MSRSCVCAVATALWLAPLPAATLYHSAVLNEDPRGQCSALVSSRPASISSVLPTQPVVYVWFALQTVGASDMVSVQFFRPDGAAVSTFDYTWTPFGTPVSFGCYTYELPVAGTIIGMTPGTWRIRINVNGSLLHTIEMPVGSASGGGGGGGTGGNAITVSGKANIFYAGRESGAPSGQAPALYRLPSGTGRVLTFSSVTGTVDCCGGSPSWPPDGGESGGTNVTSLNGISGIQHVGRRLFLAGVFLTDNAPAPPEPARLTYDTTTAHFTEARPLIAQAFYIGDGLDGHGSGSPQRFYIPDSATRLYLGLVDGYNFAGSPASYEDNTGQFFATPAVSTGGGSGGGDIAGTWAVNSNNYIGSMELTWTGSAWTGRLNLGTWEELTNITYNAATGAISFTRPRVPQYYTGVVSGDRMTGSFLSGSSSYPWSATRGSGGGGSGGTCPSTNNLARNGTATQSSTDWGGTANLGNNGVLNEPTGYGLHTGYEASPWWQVDLGRVSTLCEVRLYNRSDCCFDRARTIRVQLSSDGVNFETVYSHDGNTWGTNGVPPLSITSQVQGRSARYVRVRLNETNYLHLREVEVYGTDGSSGGGGGGTTGSNITSLHLEGGGYSTGFGGNGSVWDTEPNSYYAIGVTAPGLNNPFLNGTGTRVNAPRGSYWFYLEPGEVGSAMRLTATYADGTKESAVFSARPLSTAGAWTRLTGSTNLTLGGTGYTNLNRNTGGEALSPGGAIDFVLEAGIGTASGGGGGGGATLLELTPSRLDFGRVTVGQTKDLTLTLRNNGTSPVLISSMPVSNSSFRLISPALPISLGAGATQTLTLRFAPTAAGQQDGNITVLTAAAGLTGIGETAGGGGTGGCGYFVNPLTSSVPAEGGTGLILVTTGPGCRWEASAGASWVTITAGTSGTGSGAISYRADPHQSPSARTATITVTGSGQTVTHTITQNGYTGPPCAYTVTPPALNLTAGAGSASLFIGTGGNCAWQARSNAAWLTISGSSSGTGPATLTVAYQANTTQQERSATLTIGTATVPVTQAAPPAQGTPSVAAGGVVNAASFTPANLPGGAIARGSFFSIFGTDLGPDVPAQATEYPLRATLGQTTVTVRQSGRELAAYPVFVSKSQINAILPSTAVAGDAEILVNYNGRPGAPARIKVADHNFGAFSTAAGRGPGIIQNYLSEVNQPLNTRSATAKPTQVVTLWGTGLGPIAQSDALAPPIGPLPVDVQVLVGGKTARVMYAGRAPCCAGVDQIVFELPGDTPAGCYVPVQVRAANGYSNTVTMAIHAEQRTCADTHNIFADQLANGGRGGAVFLIRASVQAALEQGKAPTDITLDLGFGMFQNTAPSGDLGFNMLTAMPPLGSCMAYSGSLDATSLLGGAASGSAGGAVGGAIGAGSTELDAGPQLTVTGPSGNSIPMPHADTEKNTGPYAAILGGQLPIGSSSGTPPPPLFLNGGSYRVAGPGGRDIGAFSTTLSIGTPLTWTNQSAVTEVNRANPLSLTWSGDTRDRMVVIAGIGNDAVTKATAGFVCVEDARSGRFTVPPSVLGNLPAGETGALVITSLPTGNVARITASGLEQGSVIFTTLTGKQVTVR